MTEEKPAPVEGNVWVDVWLWKMVPNGEDDRPRWRQQYDNGEVKYQYTYQSSDEGMTFFRVNVPYKIMEILCTDARVPSLCRYHQRIDEMRSMDVDDYTKLAFSKMGAWFPQVFRYCYFFFQIL